jgi:hypothetical protein
MAIGETIRASKGELAQQFAADNTLRSKFSQKV